MKPLGQPTNKTYGYISARTGEFIEIGLTERGAKSAATTNGAREVGFRSHINNMYIKTSIKENGRWF